MVTKRTRLLSIVTTAIMLVSMFACFVIPASAEAATLDELVAKYEILDPAHFNDDGAAKIEEARGQLATYVEQYNANEDDESTRESIVALANDYDASVIAYLRDNETVDPNAEIRYSYKAYYEEAGWSADVATVFLISTYEDWMAAAAENGSWTGKTLKLTADIDFTGKTAAPLTGACTNKDSAEYEFKGTLDGQGKKLINMNLSLTGCYAGAVIGYSRGGVIKNLGIEGGTLAYTRGGADWYSVGSFAGRGENGFKLLNCWSTMAISGANADGKTGTAGLIGMGESTVVIDNCFFAGSINNTAGPATDTVGYGGGHSGTDIYNTIGAGTLVAATNPVAMGGWHSNLWGDKNVTTGVDETDTFTGDQAGTTYQVIHNSYAVGHDAIRFRNNVTPLSQKDATYFGEAYVVDTLNAIHSAASLKEAAWKVNSNFDTTAQEEQTYFFDVDANGKLRFITDANATLKQVTIEIVDGATEVFYLHPGDEVNLVDDLGLKSQIEAIEVPAGYESAVADKVLTVPNADITLTVTYDEAAILESAIDALEAVMAEYEAIDFALFTSEDEMAEWYEYAQEGIDLEDIDQILDAIDWETELEVELKEGVYPPFGKYDAYKAFAPAAWGISSKADWLAAVEKTTATDGTAANFLDLDFHVTTDIDFEDTPMAPLAWGAIFTGSLNGHNRVFKRINITNPANADNGVALISKVNGVVIRDLGIESGSVTSTATTTYGGWAAAFVGVQDGALEVYNCWNGASVYSDGSKNANASGLVGNCANKALKIVGFYNLGDISTGNAEIGVAAAVWGAGTSHGLTIAAHVYNAGTLTGANTRLWRSNLSAGYPARNYISNNAAYSNTSLTDKITVYCNAGDEEAAATRWDAAIVLEEDNGLYGYTLNKRATGLTDKSGNAVPAVYWTVENGVSIFGTEANQTRKVTFTGSILGDRYYATGEEVTLSDIAAGAEYTVTTAGYESAISNGVLTVPAADITINVTGNVVDIGGYIDAKAELEAFVAKINALNADLFTNGADMIAAKEAVAAVLAADAAESTNVTKQAIIDKADEQFVPVLKSDAKVPYSKKALYAEYGASATVFGIYEAADWLAIVNDNAGGNQYYVMNNVDFSEVDSMLPLGYNGNTGLTGLLDGQGHAFLNINIVAGASTNWRTGVSLVSGMNGGTIRNLGLTGNVTNTSTSATSADNRTILTAAFSAGKNNGAAWTIENCWSDVHVKGPSTATAGLAVFNSYASANDTIRNCVNYGTVESTTNGSAAVFYSAASAAAPTSNCINLGDFITTGPAAAVILHTSQASLYTNNYSVGTNNVYLRDSATYDNANMAETAGEAAWKATNGANGAVYYKLDDTYGLAFGDADNYVRKITISGTVNRVIYANNSQIIDLTTYADADYVVATEGYESALSGKVLTVPAADITITSSGNAIDLGSYTTGKANLTALQEKLAGFDMALFANGEAIAELKADIDAALAADETSDDTTKAAIIVLAAEADAFTYTLAEGKYVPYSKKDTVYSDIAANKNYGIYDAADWAAFVAAGANTGLTVHLMNNVTLDASAPILGATVFGGTFDGHENTLTVAVTVNVADGQKVGVLGSAGTIKNLKLAGTVDVTVGTVASPVPNRTFFGAISGGGATIDNCENAADITAEVYGLKRLWIAGVSGELGTVTNTTNSGDITVTGFSGINESGLGVGGIGGRTNQPCSNLTNTGNITVNDTSAAGSGNYALVGGIFGSTAGNNITNATNSGTITVTGGDTLRVGGIQGTGTDVDQVELAGTITNTGAINVTANVGAKEVSVGGIFGAMIWSVANGATISNSGVITVDGGNATKFEVGGISGSVSATATAGFAATSAGNVWVGGKDLANEAQKASLLVANTTLEITGTPTGTLTVCDHSTYSSVDDLDNVVVVNDCDNCSYTWTSELQNVDTAYINAKAELNAIVEKFEALNVDLFTNGADMTAALNAAKAVLEADETESNATTIQAIKDEAAKEDVVPVLKSDAKVPYSKKALYAEYGASATVFGIYEEADWNAMVDAGENNGITIYLMDNVTFTAASTTCINTFKGTFEGQGYTISGINITAASGRFAGLFRINSGTINNLKVDGTMNVTIGSAENYVQSVYVGIFGGQGGTVNGCTNSVDMTLTAYVGNNNNNCIGGINGYLGAVTNSINEGAMNVTLYLEGASTRVMLAGIVGRSRGAASGCTNNGAINVTINGQVGSAYISGIASDAVGTNAAGSINNGAITVTGGCYNYIGGILAPTAAVGAGSVAGASNTGDITVIGRDGENIRINSVGGIVGAGYDLPAIAEAATVTNTGDITIDAQLAAQAYAYGIAKGATAGEGTYTVSNTGKVWIGGVKEAGASWVVGNTYAGTTAANVSICGHNLGETNHIAETNTHKFECGECSYYAVADCDVTYTANDDLVYDEENNTVTATHSGICSGCEQPYTGACVGTFDEENQKFTFDCCDREDYVLEDDCQHGLGDTEWVDGTKTHIFVCGECGETVGEAESCEGYLTRTEDTGTKTHSDTCSECGHTYTEACQGTEKSNPADCTADHWMDYDCDRADDPLPDTGAEAHVWGDWTTVGAPEGYQIHKCENCDTTEQELLPLAAPVIVITTNTGKAGQTGVNFTVTLTETGIKSGTVTIALPAWAENVNLVAGTNVTIDGMVATITGNIAAGSELLTGTYDIDHLAGEAGTITATAANVLNEREESVDVAVATANAEIDVILGDAKVDGVVNLIDAIAVLRAVAGLDNDVNVANGDVDHSNGLSVDDAILIVRWWLEDPDYTGDNLGE